MASLDRELRSKIVTGDVFLYEYGDSDDTDKFSKIKFIAYCSDIKYYNNNINESEDRIVAQDLLIVSYNGDREIFLEEHFNIDINPSGEYVDNNDMLEILFNVDSNTPKEEILEKVLEKYPEYKI